MRRISCSASIGSSPLARGTRRRTHRGAGRGRFIPARAGNTSPSRSAAPSATVHPRSRGEHTWSRSRSGPNGGSSPLARGTHLRGPEDAADDRFIPARAGNTAPSSRLSPTSSVHPRSRGEHDDDKWRGVQAAGSSPLARGTHAQQVRDFVDERFIPARAGNTIARPIRTFFYTVHPRSRGEHGLPGWWHGA